MVPGHTGIIRAPDATRAEPCTSSCARLPELRGPCAANEMSGRQRCDRFRAEQDIEHRLIPPRHQRTHDLLDGVLADDQVAST